MKRLISLVAMCATPALAGSRIVTNGTAAVNWTSGVTYTYDGSGNIRSAGDDTFVYDTTGRLVAAKVDGSERDYEYDSFGNRTKCTIATGGDCQYGVHVLPGNNRIEGAGFDGAGNVQSFDGHTYSYDAANMMTRDVRPATGVAKEFIYTADDERIATYNVGSSWNWTVRDTSARVLREFTSSDGLQGRGTAGWTWTRDDVWRDGLLLATRQPVSGVITTYHYHLDQLGTSRRVTDQSDSVVGYHDYFAFGPEVSGGVTEAVASTLRYTGQERDIWSDDASLDTIDYDHARYYNPALGRFLTVDPLISREVVDQPQGWNRYAYVRNNPMLFTDPTGLYMTCETFMDIHGEAKVVCSEQIQVRGKVPKVRSISGATHSAIDLMLWVGGRLPRVSAADPASATELSGTPTMDQIREKYKKAECKDDRYWGDYQYSELTHTTNLTGQLVGSFGADIRSIGNGQIVVKAFNTWGLESATRFPGTSNRHNASIQSMVGGAPLQYPKSILENRPSGGMMGTATLNYIWVEGSPCAQ